MGNVTKRFRNDVLERFYIEETSDTDGTRRRTCPCNDSASTGMKMFGREGAKTSSSVSRTVRVRKTFHVLLKRSIRAGGEYKSGERKGKKKLKRKKKRKKGKEERKKREKDQDVIRRRVSYQIIRRAYRRASLSCLYQQRTSMERRVAPDKTVRS